MAGCVPTFSAASFVWSGRAIRWAIPSSSWNRDRIGRIPKQGRGGIRLRAGRDWREIAWRDVERLHITRVDPVRRDFRELELKVPGEQIELRMIAHEGGTTPSWRGAGAEQVNDFLIAYVSQERMVIDTDSEPSAHPIDVKSQLDRARKRERELRLVWWGYVLSMGACLIWFAWDHGIQAALFMAGVAGLLAPVFWVFLRQQRQQTDELATRLAELENEAPRSSSVGSV